jgi:hypothetical protein
MTATMTNKEEVTNEVVKVFDDYYYERFWYVLNKEQEPSLSKKPKIVTTSVVELDENETLAIALGAVDYYIMKCEDEVYGDDAGRTLFVKEIHERAKECKAKYAADLFDAAEIGAALKLKMNDDDREQKLG